MMPQVPGWTLDEEGKVITRLFEFKHFKGAMEFVNKVAEIAEKEGHHPDISISWNKVRLDLSTHAIGGLSTNDFVLASKINTL
jgi:4a-hydroxytetrahydrobiopterin dehydratase